MATLATVFERLEPYITQRMQMSRTPGLALAMFDTERCEHVAVWGFAELERQTPLTPNHLFPIGSITKSFVALAIVQAAEQKLLKLHDPVTDYLDWFQVQSRFDPITIHHLLTHSAGLIGIVDQTPDMQSAVWALRHTEAAWAPGSHFYYSDAGYQTLALILESVYKQPLAAIFQTNIFDPLQMNNSEPALTHAIRPRIAQGYRYLYDDRPEHASQPLVPAAWIETNAGDSCIASTVEDMANYGRMLLNRGQGPNGRLMSPESYEQLVGQQMKFDWYGGGAYGYGLMNIEHDGLPHLWHGGGMTGHLADLLLDPQHGLGIVVLRSQPSFGDTAFKAMSLWRAGQLDRSLDTIDLSMPDPTRIENAQNYAGVYRSQTSTLTFTAEDERLILHHSGQQIPLEGHGNDRFYIHHPDFELYLLHFGRMTAADGTNPVVEAFHGSTWYTNEKYDGAVEFDYPSEWDAYPGHYRAHIPWETNFRVVLRKGQLWLVRSSGSEEPLTALGDSHFRIDDETSPERLQFDQIVNGQAFQAKLSSGDYYRFFTP